MGDGIFLDDLDNRPLVVIKIRLPVPVGVQGDILVRGVHQIGVIPHRLLGDFEYPRPEVGDGHRAVRPGGHFGHAAAIRLFHQKCGVGDGDGVVVRVKFPDGEAGPLVVLQADGAVLAREQFYMVLGRVQQVVRYCGHLLQGVNARLQALPDDLACAGGGAVQIPGAVLDLGQAVGDARQRGAVRALLIQIQGG